MNILHTPWLSALIAALVNLPFGYWRAGSRKFSVSWIIAIHLPVLLSIGLRFCLKVPFRLVTLPLFVAAFVGGPYLGARIYRRTRK